MTRFRLLKGTLVALTIACSATNAVFAASQQESISVSKSNGNGILRGRVVDGELHTMAGAAIYIKELNRGVAADVDGYYTMQDVPVGTYTLVISYVGYSQVNQEVTINNRETTIADITISEATTIDNVVVESVMSGQARAMTSQKSALNMVDVISQDQTSKYPDANIGDALKRIAGINVQYDQGEARFVQVRGTSPDLTSVTINGGRIPSAEGETRNAQLDLIPADMIQTIEVNKVITPDMEADAIGGSVNLVTKNSPARRVFTATAGTGYDVVSQKPQMNFALTYGDKLSDKFGYMLSASYQNNPIGSDNTEFEWTQDDNGDIRLKEMQIRQYYVQRERQSYSASFNWNINKNHMIDFRGLYNLRNDWENRYKTKVKLKEGGEIKEAAVETKAGTEDQKYGRLEKQQTMDYTLGGEHLIGKLAVKWSGSFSAASEDRPNERYVAFAAKGYSEDCDVDYSDMRQPYVKNAADLLTLDKIMANGGKLDEVSESQQEIQEYNYGGKVDFKYEIGNGSYSTKIRAGAKYKMKDKSVDIVCMEYQDTITDEADFVASALAATSIQDRAGFMPGEVYNFGREFTTREFVGDLNLKDASKFGAGEEKKSEGAGNYNATEAVTAAYVRVDQQLGRRLSLMAGVRMENTAISNSGYIYIDEDKEITPTKTKKSSYTNVLPSVLMKWDATKDLKLRLSYTNTIARPKYSDLVNNVVTEDDTEKIRFGNPDLKATLAHNVDLSADYYFESIGLIRGGVFYKQINDFIVDQRKTDFPYGGYTYDSYKKAINGGDATLYGFEVNFSRDFSFISKSLNCVGFAGTYTYTHTDAESHIEGREDINVLPGSPKNTANASIYFSKWGLTTRVSYNYASAFLDEIDDEAFSDTYYDSVNYLDLNVSYKFKKRWTIYADATNLMNQPLRYYQGSPERTKQAEYYGPRFNAGVKFVF